MAMRRWGPPIRHALQSRAIRAIAAWVAGVGLTALCMLPREVSRAGGPTYLSGPGHPGHAWPFAIDFGHRETAYGWPFDSLWRHTYGVQGIEVRSTEARWHLMPQHEILSLWNQWRTDTGRPPLSPVNVMARRWYFGGLAANVAFFFAVCWGYAEARRAWGGSAPQRERSWAAFVVILTGAVIHPVLACLVSRHHSAWAEQAFTMWLVSTALVGMAIWLWPRSWVPVVALAAIYAGGLMGAFACGSFSFLAGMFKGYASCVAAPLATLAFAHGHLWYWSLRRSPPPGRCRQCGYILYGLPSNRCPECGTTFDPAEATVPPEADHT